MSSGVQSDANPQTPDPETESDCEEGLEAELMPTPAGRNSDRRGINVNLNIIYHEH